ncbi:MAG: HsdR family type I site-specific deoxyribonuclease [Microcoleaceae cyanobacterium]
MGQKERETQKRVIQLFQTELKYEYLGNWQYRKDNRNIEAELLRRWLSGRGVGETLINKALRQLEQAAALGGSTTLYDANQAVYGLLRYGVKVKVGAGEQNQTVWLIDWENPDKNEFAIAEEVTVKGNYNKRPDIVLYVNGIVLGVLELKRSSVSIGEGIRQNLDNQKSEFIRPFFTTMQLVMAGNETQGLRYGTIETPEKYYLNWKEENPDYNPQTDSKIQRYYRADDCGLSSRSLLDCSLIRLCEKNRFLEILYSFIVFDAGIKKTCRHNQYFGVKAAQKFIQRRDNGIIWHTQGSGKSLTMVWLAKWIKENITQPRVLIITDRTELDDQIEKVFLGVDENIVRIQNGAALVATLDANQDWLICALIHKFGGSYKRDAEAFAAELTGLNLKPQTIEQEIFVFVDECHRTQSGNLNQAMKQLLPNAVLIGFTGTPLLKADKQKSIEVFGEYIHTYKYDQAVTDGVVLDLRYEARDIDQYLTSPDKINRWFDIKTRGLSDQAKTQLKQKWGTMQKLLSSKSRLEQIVKDILWDMNTKPRLMDGRGNALLVCSSVYEACKVYDLFSQTSLKDKCAIITSYKPSAGKIKGEETGQGLTEKLQQYEIYRQMLARYFNEAEEKAMHRVEEFEKVVKKQFIEKPGQMRLLIVVDKLLTGFDAPSATYLYINKKMRDHGLFQAICRVNRLDGEDKEYGYIVDYQDLFKKLEQSITDYTSGAFDTYDPEDVEGLLKDRLEKANERLEQTRETVKALCEPVKYPGNTEDYLHYFCTPDGLDQAALAANEPKRIKLYQSVAALIRAYAAIANDMEAAGYSPPEAAEIKAEVNDYAKMRDQVKLASGDYLDMKQYEPDMRHLLDSYIQANESKTLSQFKQLGLIELIVQNGINALDQLPEGLQESPQTMAETIENNMRQVITLQNPVNPKYYGEMSDLLDDLIQGRRQQAIDYQEYLKQVEILARQVIQKDNTTNYPDSINTDAKRSLYDNLEQNEPLALKINQAVRTTKKADWIGNKFKEKEVKIAIAKVLSGCNINIDVIFNLVKNQSEYH